MARHRRAIRSLCSILSRVFTVEEAVNRQAFNDAPDRGAARRPSDRTSCCAHIYMITERSPALANSQRQRFTDNRATTAQRQRPGIWIR